jgi:phospholipase/carboxylesterase
LLSIEIGLRYPHRFAGIVGISGWVCEQEKLLQELSPVAKQQRLLLTHGHFDAILPFVEIREQAQRLKAAGLNVEWREFPKAHTIHGEEELAIIREFVRAGYPVVGG